MASTQTEEYYVQELILVNELIKEFFQIFKLKEKDIKILSPGLSELQKEFEPKYLKFLNIKRFAIPFIGRISSGKSTFLNFLSGLKNILESNTDISTKIVCIIRHNTLVSEPKAYKVILEKRDIENNNNQNSFPMFNFEKGEELKDDIRKIIQEKNDYIKKTNQQQLKIEDYFIIIETKIPLITPEMEKYSKIFEFMDLPGLNEYDKNNDYFFIKNILPVISNNVKFSFFIFDCLSLKDKDSSDIYNNYIDLLNCKN